MATGVITASLTFRVTMGDVDADRIHFTTLFNYMDRLHGELWAALGYPTREILARGLALPVVRAECEYRRALRLDDLVTGTAYVGEVGRTSFTEVYEFRDVAGTLVAIGRITHVYLEDGKPTLVPEWLRQQAVPALTQRAEDQGSPPNSKGNASPKPVPQTGTGLTMDA